MKDKIPKFIQEALKLADIKINGNRAWDIKVNNSRIYDRVLRYGSLGLGESYMDGDWDCRALDKFFYRITKAELQENIKFSPEIAFRFLKALIFN